MPEFVWIVGNMDYGDNGWSIARVFLSREEADEWVNSHPQKFGYWEIEKHIVGDAEGDLGGSHMWEE